MLMMKILLSIVGVVSQDQWQQLLIYYVEKTKLILKIQLNIFRNLAPHANPNKLLIKHFEKKLDVSNQISKSFLKFPYTKTYDCSSNFAPVTLFDIKDIEKN